MNNQTTKAIGCKIQRVNIEDFIASLDYRSPINPETFPIDSSTNGLGKQGALRKIIKNTLEQVVLRSNNRDFWKRKIDASVKGNFPAYQSCVTPWNFLSCEDLIQYDITVALYDNKTGLFIICTVLMQWIRSQNDLILDII